MAADDHRKISDGGHSDPGVDPATRHEAAGDRREGRNPGPPEPADPDSHVLPGAHLVLGHRHGPLGTAALRVGADLATRLRAALHVVHVVDLVDYPIDPDAWDWDQQADRALLAERRDVETELAELGTPWTYRADRGDPVSLLRQVADDHDALMIIVGTRGEGAGSGLSRLLGTPSVSHGLVARTHRPVLVVPPHAAAPPNATDR